MAVKNRVLYFACAAGGITLGLAGLLLYSTLSRDRWEPFHIVDCLQQLDKADKIRETDPLGAYRVYESVIAEAAPHKIADAEFKQRLLSAASSKDSLYPVVEQAIRKQEAEKKRTIEEKRRHAEQKIREVAEAVRARRAAGEERRRKEEDAKKLAARIRARTASYATLRISD